MESADGRRRPALPVAAVLFMVGWLAWQLLLPAWRLVQPDRPARFGWHMYSAVAVAPPFVVEYADGAVDTVRVSNLSSRWRPEIDAAAFLPPYLCGSRAGAVAVHVLPVAGSAGEVRPCR